MQAVHRNTFILVYIFICSNGYLLASQFIYNNFQQNQEEQNRPMVHVNIYSFYWGAKYIIAVFARCFWTHFAANVLHK